MAIIIGAGMRIGAGISVSSSRVLSIIEFDFQGDLQILDGDAIDLMLGSGVEDLGLGDSFGLYGDLMTDTGVIDLMLGSGVEDLNLGLEGDLIDQIGVEDLLSGSGTVDLMD
jgi:hypothetical protein